MNDNNQICLTIGQMGAFISFELLKSSMIVQFLSVRGGAQWSLFMEKVKQLDGFLVRGIYISLLYNTFRPFLTIQVIFGHFTHFKQLLNF